MGLRCLLAGHSTPVNNERTCLVENAVMKLELVSLAPQYALAKAPPSLSFNSPTVCVSLVRISTVD